MPKVRTRSASAVHPGAGREDAGAKAVAGARGTRASLLVVLLLAVLTLAAFWRVLACEFTDYDDVSYVTSNAHVQAGLTSDGMKWALTTMECQNWQPLTWVSLMADRQVYGPGARGFHLTNLLLHIASVLLLFLVLSRMTGSHWKSAFVAALFAVHPLHVESVAWVAERKDVLSTLFWMLTMGAYVLYAERPSIRRYLPIMLFFALGLMSKPMLVTLPLVLLLLDYWPLRRFSESRGFGKLFLEKLPLFALALGTCVVTYIAQQHGEAVQSWEKFPLGVRAANTAVSYIAYIGKMLWPRALAVYYHHPGTSLPAWEVVGAALLLALFSTAALHMRRKHRYLTMGWFWYLGTLVPVIGLVQVGTQAMADRYTYVPLIGLFVMIAWGLPECTSAGESGRRSEPKEAASGGRILVIAGVTVIAVLTTCTYRQVGYWHDSETLYRHALAVTTDNNLAYGNLSRILFNQGKFDEAMKLLRTAVVLSPDDVSAHRRLGLSLAVQGKLDEALPEFERAISLDPKSAENHDNYADGLMAVGRLDTAISEYQQAIKLDSNLARAHAGLDEALKARELANRSATTAHSPGQASP